VQVKQVARVITGKVTDIDGKPVPFATVKIKETVIGVSANANGVYSIKAHTGDVLEFSCAGFESQHIAIVNNNSVIDVQLHIIADFNNVVVTASCFKRESRAMGGLEVKVLDSAKTNRVKDVAKGLAEKVSSSQINLFNKDTATHNTTVRMGGVRSIQGTNQALLVVDDVLHPISYIATLNPNDVERINVLKGTAASALYGSDAANGVIIITTKHKKADETTKAKKDSIARSIVNTVTDSVRLLIKPNTIKVYPNPVQRGNACFVSLLLKQPGDLQMQVTDINGIVVLKKQVAAGTKDILDKIETGLNWPAGIYFISIYDTRAAGKLISKVSFSVL
jgi:TonB-dependent SusC/RagA subfamily outer membrane receptor